MSYTKEQKQPIFTEAMHKKIFVFADSELRTMKSTEKYRVEMRNKTYKPQKFRK